VNSLATVHQANFNGSTLAIKSRYRLFVKPRLENSGKLPDVLSISVDKKKKQHLASYVFFSIKKQTWFTLVLWIEKKIFFKLRHFENFTG
jgi:hypothetical protein